MIFGSPSQRRGKHYERQALAYLEKAGLRLIAANYTTRSGEIDLIMADGDTVSFIEVRFRADSSHGSGIDTVNAEKQKKLIKAASHFLLKKDWYDKVHCRFDVVGVDADGRCQWIKSAFDAF